ncbi:MAG TPA: M14 family zinc carboxypeptidase, partial [Allocoleopsis sp.]
MAPNDYLSVKGIGDGLQYLKTTYSGLCHSTVALSPSILGQPISAIKIAGGTRTDRRGVLFIAGLHARELINPDLLIFFALKLCQAYTNNVGLTFGGKSYSASAIQLIINNLDLFLLPLTNPDGRAWVQSPTGYAMWRKNRRTNPGSSCLGVDLNRNFDFLWSSGIGTSAEPCSDVYKGSTAMSEPEVRNVRTLLDTY